MQNEAKVAGSAACFACQIQQPGTCTCPGSPDTCPSAQTLSKVHKAGVQHVCPPVPHGSGSLDGRHYLPLQLCGKNMSNALLQASALTRTSSAVRKAGDRLTCCSTSTVSAAAQLTSCLVRRAAGPGCPGVPARSWLCAPRRQALQLRQVPCTGRSVCLLGIMPSQPVSGSSWHAARPQACPCSRPPGCS